MSEEIIQTSWWQRIKDSFKSIIVGLLLIAIAIFILFWNENHSIKTKLSLIEASKILIQIPNEPINPVHDEKVVYVTGLATTNEKLFDDLLEVDVNAINLNRQVEMYQWHEIQNSSSQSNIGGSKTETVDYQYQIRWSSKLTNSQNFNDSNHHINPKEMRVLPKKQYAKEVTLGDFKLPTELITQINNAQTIILSDRELIIVKKQLREPASLYQDQIYLGKNPENPAVGDIKIALSAVYPQQVSVIAVQVGSTFEPYIAKAGEQVMLLESGNIPANVMINNALDKNKLLTYWLRFLSLFLMVVGISLLFTPLVVIGDVIPVVGTFLSYGRGLFSLIAGISLWSILFAVAWITVRPLLGLTIIGTLILMISLLYYKKQKVKKDV